jgi:hypothetical protein
LSTSLTKNDAYRNSINKVDTYITTNNLTSTGISDKPSALLREDYISNSNLITSSSANNREGRFLPPTLDHSDLFYIDGDNQGYGNTSQKKDLLPRGHIIDNTSRPEGKENPSGGSNGCTNNSTETEKKNEIFNKFNTNSHHGHWTFSPEKDKENIFPLPKGFMRASEYPYDGNMNTFSQNDSSRQTPHLEPENRDNTTIQPKPISKPFTKGQSGPFVEKEEISEPEHLAHRYTDHSHQLRAGMKPLRDITNSSDQYVHGEPTSQRVIFGIANSGSNYQGASANPFTQERDRFTNSAPHHEKDLEDTSHHMPLVPYRTHRQETHDEDDLFDYKRRNRYHDTQHTHREDDEESARSERRSTKHRRSRKERGSDSDDSSTHHSRSSHTSRDKKDSTPTLFALLQTMDCQPNYLEALANLKHMMKRSDLTEVLPPRHESERSRRRQVRYNEYFPEKYTGRATKLKRYLQRLLQYSAQVANDDQTRADIMADGAGLSET